MSIDADILTGLYYNTAGSSEILNFVIKRFTVLSSFPIIELLLFFAMFYLVLFKPLTKSMKIKEKEFEELSRILKQLPLSLGAEVRFEKGDFKGGYCLLKESKVIVINKSANLQRKVMILAMALKELGVDSIYLNPSMREIIDEMVDAK
jgi:hypothetical protein